MRLSIVHCGLLSLMMLKPLPAWAAGNLEFVWEDRFSRSEQARLSAWVEETVRAVETLVGPFPMPIRVYFHRREGTGEPVPWAHTWRGRPQSVHFHVDTAFSTRSFRHDWTAPHELSHLILPYLGENHAWFAEGFASYLQYPVMQAMGVLSPSAARERLRRNLAQAREDYRHHGTPFPRAAPRLRQEGRYPVLYWGGAAYFLQVDAALARRGTDLQAVLADYMACCRRNHDSLSDLIRDLDRVSNGSTFATVLARFQSRPGFPEIPRPARETEP